METLQNGRACDANDGATKGRIVRECSRVVEQREHESNVLVMRGMAQRRNETGARAVESWGEASVSRTWLRHGDRETKERNAGGCAGIMGWGKLESNLLVARAARNERTKLARLESER